MISSSLLTTAKSTNLPFNQFTFHFFISQNIANFIKTYIINEIIIHCCVSYHQQNRLINYIELHVYNSRSSKLCHFFFIHSVNNDENKYVCFFYHKSIIFFFCELVLATIVLNQTCLLMIAKTFNLKLHV